MTSRAASLSEMLATADGYRKAGRLAQADELCREILKVKPDHPNTLHLRALIARDVGDKTRAIDLVRRAIAADARDPLLLYSLAELCRRAGRLDEALEANRQALSLEPQSPRAITSLGSTHAARGQYQEAISHLRHAIAIAPDYAMAHFNLGHAFHALGELGEALKSKDEAVRLDPHFLDGFGSRGITLQEMGRFDEAEADWKHVLALNPNHADAQTNLALSELRRGRFLEGFPRYEWRWRSKDAAPRPGLPTPWQGEDPAGKRFLIHAEQGFGDTLQFCRYLPQLRDRGARLVLLLPSPLLPLIANSMPWLELSHGPRPPSDIQSTLLSLPHLLKTTLDTIPATIPYIHAPAQAISRLGAVIGQGAELKIGLAWAGNPKHSLDKDRSLPFAALAPILAVEGVRFFSLQIGEAARDASNGIIDLSPELPDFAQTAGAIANLDLVICVDTAVAHLAGAMGKRVFIMLPFLADWRWLREREDSPWYPTAHLFRQKTHGDWRPVANDIAKALEALVEARGRRQSREKAAEGPGTKIGAPSTSPNLPGETLSLSDLLAIADEHRKAGRLSKADELCRQILEAKPLHPDTLHLRARIAQDAGDRPAAVAFMRQAIATNSRDPFFYCGLADMFRAAGLLDEALAASQRGLALHPHSPQALYGVGTMLCARGEYPEAIDVLRQVIELAPKASAAHMNLAHAFHKLARFDHAETHWKQALVVDPSHAEAHRNLGMCYLLRGNLTQGFSHYQWRFRIQDGPPRPKLLTPWDGGDPRGKRMLVHAEQGYGDTLQFCRYLPILRDAGARLVLNVPRSLRSLMAHSMSWLELQTDHPPSTDFQTTLPSLPHLLKTTLEIIPAPIPYIHAPPQAISRFAGMIGRRAELKVGLVWAGNPEHLRDRDRSLVLSALAPILAIEGARFFGLQIGAAAQDVSTRDVSTGIIDLAPELTDFAQTAGAIANLDLVISVDTAVAHLAGAMGKPVWIMLPFVPDWRWLLERQDSPWYPTARLFRQRARGDWEPVVKELAEAVAGLAQATAARHDMRPRLDKQAVSEGRG
jgi:tetratricopeptide (TPR) repeat protein